MLNVNTINFCSLLDQMYRDKTVKDIWERQDITVAVQNKALFTFPLRTKNLILLFRVVTRQLIKAFFLPTKVKTECVYMKKWPPTQTCTQREFSRQFSFKAVDGFVFIVFYLQMSSRYFTHLQNLTVKHVPEQNKQTHWVNSLHKNRFTHGVHRRHLIR